MIVTLKVWLCGNDYDCDLLARMFAVGDTRLLREVGPGYMRELPPLPPKASVAPVGFDLTETDPDVADALTLLDRPRRGARWVELYKVLEIVQSDGSIEAVAKEAGVSNNEIGGFK